MTDIDDLPREGYMGVDPGADGSVGYSWQAGSAAVWRFKKLTDQEIWGVFLALSTKAKAAAIEKTQAMPGMGTVSRYKIGRSSGLLEGFLIAARIRYDWVTPQKWQGQMRCRSKGDKNVTKAAAQKLWPHIKIVHGNADGLLIAEWCRIWSPWGK